MDTIESFYFTSGEILRYAVSQLVTTKIKGLKMVKQLVLFFVVAVYTMNGKAHPQAQAESDIHAYASLKALRALNIPILAKSETADVGYAYLTPAMQMKLSEYNHSQGKCGGFEAVATDHQQVSINQSVADLKSLESQVQKDKSYSQLSFKIFQFSERPEIMSALENLREDNIRNMITWLSSYPNRFNKDANPNTHVDQFYDRVNTMMAAYQGPWKIEKVAHQSTRQQSIRVTITGKSRPQEIVVVGGHLDSINQSWMGSKKAPGADDNASGSSNIFEALRVLISQPQPERTIEFYWYAGEESGLLGSAEIAKHISQQIKLSLLFCN